MLRIEGQLLSQLDDFRGFYCKIIQVHIFLFKVLPISSNDNPS
jgi:hypothetical protein